VTDETNRQKKIELIDGETVLRIIHPHLLSKYKDYVVYLCIILTGALWDVLGRFGVSCVKPSFWNELNRSIFNLLSRVNLSFLAVNPDTCEVVTRPLWTILIWAAVMIVLGGIFTFLFMNVGWLKQLTLISFLGVLLSLLTRNAIFAPLVGVVFALVSSIYVFFLMQAHTYLITDKRIILRIDFLTRHVGREVDYHHLVSLLIKQTNIGRWFDFGRMIPVLNPDLIQHKGDDQKDKELNDAITLYGVPHPGAVQQQIEPLLRDALAENQLADKINEAKQVKFLT
jgi:hypothetical protein